MRRKLLSLLVAVALAGMMPGAALAQDDDWFGDDEQRQNRSMTQNDATFGYYDCYDAGWDSANDDDDWFFDFYEYDQNCEYDTSLWDDEDYYDEDFGYNHDDDTFDWEEDDLFVG